MSTNDLIETAESAELDKIVIDEEFRALIPPLRPDERDQLRENLRAAKKCRDPLSVWAGRKILLDGHNRYELCEELGIPYTVEYIELLDRESAADWIDANQLGRRNLAEDQQALLLGRRFNRAKRQGARTDLTSGHSVQKLSTAERLGREHGVSAKTVQRAGKFADAVQAVKRVDGDIEKKVAAGQAPPRGAVVKAAKLLEKSPEKAKAVLAGVKRLVDVSRDEKAERQEQRRQENASKIQSARESGVARIHPGARFATIVIDPPWDWGDEGDVNQLGRAKPEYATLSFDELKALKLDNDRPLGDHADDDCHIYLWITNRSLHKGFALLDAWGFRYVTCVTWCKPSIGMGNYFRGSTEHVLFGVKGSQQLKRKDVGTWFAAGRGPKGHSSKPVEFYDLVESCSPGPYLEVFSRLGRKGWVAWGADAPAEGGDPSGREGQAA